MAIGAGAGLAAVAFAAPLDDGDSLVYHAMLITGIAWVYMGFALADGRVSAIVVQAIAAAAFTTLAFVAFTIDSRLALGLGFVAHGAWDWLHHGGHRPTEVPGYYPPFCAVADVVIAVPLLAEWV